MGSPAAGVGVGLAATLAEGFGLDTMPHKGMQSFMATIFSQGYPM